MIEIKHDAALETGVFGHVARHADLSGTAVSDCGASVRTRSGPSRLMNTHARSKKRLDKFSLGIIEVETRRLWMVMTRTSIAGARL
jgi:hypothetical protein